MKLWIARDKDNALWLYNAKPIKNESLGAFVGTGFENGYWCEEYSLDEESFPEVTFENSPQEVELKLIEK